MAEIPEGSDKITTEETSSDRSVSEALLQRIGQAVNYVLNRLTGGTYSPTYYNTTDDEEVYAHFQGIDNAISTTDGKMRNIYLGGGVVTSDTTLKHPEEAGNAIPNMSLMLMGYGGGGGGGGGSNTIAGGGGAGGAGAELRTVVIPLANVDSVGISVTIGQGGAGGTGGNPGVDGTDTVVTVSTGDVSEALGNYYFKGGKGGLAGSVNDGGTCPSQGNAFANPLGGTGGEGSNAIDTAEDGEISPRNNVAASSGGHTASASSAGAGGGGGNSFAQGGAGGAGNISSALGAIGGSSATSGGGGGGGGGGGRTTVSGAGGTGGGGANGRLFYAWINWPASIWN